MKKVLVAVSVAVMAVALPAAALAQATHDHAMPAQSGASSRPAPAEGEVRAVDRTQGTVVIKHGPLVALNMPAMTMEFTAGNPALLASVKPGDKVRFNAEQRKDGALVVTSIEVVKK
jgi:Cu(I)/Ag(I) efflux system periplasmic protein CusF